MMKSKFGVYALSAVCFLLSQEGLGNIPNTGSVEDKAKVKTALTQVQNKIKKLEKTVYHNQHQERSLHAQLAAVEKEMGEQSEKLRELEQKIASHQSTLKHLQEQQASLQASQQKQLGALSLLVKNSFYQQQKERIQLLLEPQEWSTLARMNEYYRRFYHARANHLNELKNDLMQLQLLQEPLLREQQATNELAAKLQSQQLALEDKRAQRQALLSSLSLERLSAQEKLTALQHQEEHLAQLFKTLQDKLSVTPTYIEPVQDFSKMKRKLSLPVQVPGVTLALIPHAKKENSKKTYIEANAGTPVNAIFPGKVVFAEWLRGVGLLIILDHGNGYMSLYGNNQKLYKSLGESVNQGEMIARVGQSGGHAKAGLYFEIRKDGEALDPTPWFQRA